MALTQNLFLSALAGSTRLLNPVKTLGAFPLETHYQIRGNAQNIAGCGL